MPKINREEYEVLKEALSDGYEWLARDMYSALHAHHLKPTKRSHWIQLYWGNTGNGYKEIDWVEEHLDDDGYVHGYYLDGYIVGGFIEVNSEYTNLEYWVPIEEDTLRAVPS